MILLTYGHLMLGRRTEALAEVCAFLEEGRNSDPVFRVRALASLCNVYWYELDLKGMQHAASQCLETASESNLPDSVVYGRVTLGIVHYLRDELDEAERILSPVMDQVLVTRTLSFSRCAFVLALVFSVRGQHCGGGRIGRKNRPSGVGNWKSSTHPDGRRFRGGTGTASRADRRGLGLGGEV